MLRTQREAYENVVKGTVLPTIVSFVMNRPTTGQSAAMGKHRLSGTEAEARNNEKSGQDECANNNVHSAIVVTAV